MYFLYVAARYLICTLCILMQVFSAICLFVCFHLIYSQVHKYVYIEKVIAISAIFHSTFKLERDLGLKYSLLS